MDETRSIATASVDSAPPEPPNSNDELDREAPSATGDDDDDEDESLSLVKKGATSDKDGRILVRKSALALLVFLLIAFMALFGYFFAEWYMARKEAADEASTFRGVGDIPITVNNVTNDGGCVQEDEEEVVPDCPYTFQDMEALQLEIDRLEELLAKQEGDDCEFSLEDVLQLQQEIDRLEAANDQLADQLDDYADLNNLLNASIQELQVQNGILAANNDEYEALNGQLNASLAELREQNAFLAEQVDIYAGLNQDLNATAYHLEEQVDRLEGEVDELTLQNDRLEALVGSFSTETEHLSELGDLLQDNVDRLEDKIEDLMVENDRLEGLVADLQTVADFLDDAAQNLNESFDEVTAFLAEQISTNRFLVVENLQNTYHQRVANWDCALRDRFALEDFTRDGNMPIPDDIFPVVMLYVEERVLSDLCLDTSDFELYMSNRYNGEDITVNRLTTSVQRYTWDALDHYFPEADEDGVAPEAWAAAAYECGNLSPENQYFTMVN